MGYGLVMSAHPASGLGHNISDLTCFGPAAALSREPRPGCWRVVEYATAVGIEGAMLFAAPEDEAPPITLPLEARGPHAIPDLLTYPV